ncbi:2,3-dihydro-2,3-dihydroxybenzoate synthetase [Stenotrophomonas sp. ESTM1D_MKCIP4_1]|uniref:isochorismatase family protein n=1 Tax=Stenotrophomonas sp. ESTM1D_MKCIP4_1 TaxID=2072414 RepID=UPI000D53ED1C|nr:isochorismatase family protein [Stenotrophomonas sp. ESTM1D_MKCIP4_1]AWH53652.1 2,3-dihydro-2,3-dihydroxybenzoate synthetase [Stenotrophomonas sp. ESTM1D_MKCIP4_1]
MALPRITPYPLPTAAELPAARGPWRPQRDRIALLVHDMQRYFLAAFDADAEPLRPAVANIARLLAHCRAHGIPVFYTAQHGDQDRRDRGLQADLWGPGMRRSDEHEPIIDALAPLAAEHVLVKHRYSAFQRSNLETLMRVRGRDQLLVTGVYAHIGCTATVAEAFQRDIEAFIAADAVADFSRADHDQALHWIARTSGVPMTTDHLLEVL